MTVTLGTTPHSNWQQLAPLWHALGCATEGEANPEEWYHSGSQAPDGKLILAYSGPLRTLLNAMAQGHCPQVVLSQWAEHAQALIRLFKANRSRAVVINIQQAADNMQQAASVLAAHWQTGIEQPEVPKQEPAAAANPYYSLIAHAAVTQDSALPRLLAQLDACSLPLADTNHTADLPNPDDLYKQLISDAESADRQQQHREQQHQQARTRLTEENQLLLEQLHQVQEELEQKILTARSAEKQHAELAAALKKEQAAHTKTSAEKATLQNQFTAIQGTGREQAQHMQAQMDQAAQAHREVRARLEEENQLLLEQLHLVQEEYEQTVLAANRTESQLQQLTSQHAAVQKEHQLLQARVFKLRTTLEELERTNSTLNGNLAELKNQLAAARKEQADWESKYHQTERTGTLALAAANRRISELNTELNKVTGSRRWRLANPTNSYSKKSRKAAADQLERQIVEVENSGLFDEAWYWEQYPDVVKAGVNPIEHYLKTGAYEGRNPSATFDTAWYLSNYRDVTDSGLNPLVHYIRFGRHEARASRPGGLVSLPAPDAATPVQG